MHPSREADRSVSSSSIIDDTHTHISLGYPSAGTFDNAGHQRAGWREGVATITTSQSSVTAITSSVLALYCLQPAPVTSKFNSNKRVQIHTFSYTVTRIAQFYILRLQACSGILRIHLHPPTSIAFSSLCL